MKATIKLFSKRNQSIKVAGSIERVKSIATVIADTLTYEVKDSLPIGKQLAQISYFAERALGARYKAVLGAGKKMPATMFFLVEIDGKVFSSETTLVKANFKNLVKVSLKQLSALEANAIIGEVAKIQNTGLKQSLNYLADIRNIAEESVKVTGLESVLPETMQVLENGELAQV